MYSVILDGLYNNHVQPRGVAYLKESDEDITNRKRKKNTKGTGDRSIRLETLARERWS